MTATAPVSAASPPAARTLLSALSLRQPAVVVEVTAPPHAPEWAAWLAQIGFLPGEAVSVMTFAQPGGDPLVVRVGDSTFALRRAEAACVQVDLASTPNDATADRSAA